MAMKQELRGKIDESQVLVEILCNNKWNDNWIEDIETDVFIKLAVKNKVLSTVSHKIFEKGIDSLFQGTKAHSRLKEALLLNQRDILAYKTILNLLTHHFSEKNIDLCLLKGLSLVGDVPRDMGDLDLLIHEADLLIAIELMEELGFSYVGDKRNHYIKKTEVRKWDKLKTWSNQFEFFDRETGVLVELHTNLFERYRVYPFKLDLFLDSIDEFWLRSIWSEKLQCRILSIEDRLWLLTMHNSIKRSAPNNQFVLRSILDIRNILEEYSPDWINIIERALKTNTLVFLIYSLEMTSLFFPQLIEEKPILSGNLLLNRKEKKLKQVMDRCFLNLKYVDNYFIIIYRFILPFIVKSRLSHKLKSISILGILFPPYWRLHTVYGVSENSKLLPFLYIFEPIRWLKMAIIAIRRKSERKFKNNGSKGV